tara:strand:- start:1015 stop:1986 length:972 start_codon:yes stop_codon:yes gene_type:complete
MKKIKFLFSLFIILGVIFLAMPNFRHYFLSGLVKIPSLISSMRYQRHLEARSFDAVVDILRDEYAFINLFSSTENKFLMYFVQNLNDTYKLTELVSEKTYYRSLVEDILNKYPPILPIYDIESDILINNNESIETIINKLESENISYRPIYMKGIISDILQKKNSSEFCPKYLSESLTDNSIPYHREMLSIQNGNIASIVISNNEERIAWSTITEVGGSFVRLNYDNVISSDNLSLVISTQLGSKLTLNSLNLYNKGIKYSLSDYILYSEEAMFVKKNQLIALDRNTKINFLFDKKIDFDAIEIDINILPRNPSSFDVCNIYQ